jgi:ribosomal protein S18 acetylase RimI-like enzyme
MTPQIQPYDAEHLDAVVALSLRAWAPVFESIKETLPPDLYDFFYPDWRADQKKSVEDACTGGKHRVWVALVDETVAGFVAVKFDGDSRMGEIYMIAVDPDFQRRGIAAALTEFALDRMQDAGMTLALVETGLDPGHAPARATYEKMGFGLWPAARYFRKL